MVYAVGDNGKNKCLWKRLPVLFFLHNDSYTHTHTHTAQQREMEWKRVWPWHRLARAHYLHWISHGTTTLSRSADWLLLSLFVKDFLLFHHFIMRQQDVIYSTEYLNRFLFSFNHSAAVFFSSSSSISKKKRWNFFFFSRNKCLANLSIIIC